MSNYPQDRKTYRFFNLKNAFFYNRRTKTRTEFVSITVEAVLSEKIPPAFTTLETGKARCSFKIAIPNRGKYIAHYCGKYPREVEENGDMVTWARVAAFGDIASRFSKFVAKHPNCYIVICGRIAVTEVEKNGMKYVNTDIIMDDFNLMRDNNKPSAANDASFPAVNSDAEPATSYSGGITDFDPDNDMDFDEDDKTLPF